MILFCVLIALIGLLVIWAVRGYVALNKHNDCPLEIETFDGHHSPYHPSVLYFENGFSGHKFWMAETPFPPEAKPYIDRWECPSIHVSEDGYEWKNPKGLTNPIDDLTDSEIKDFDFFSDPHLFMRGDTMECWYRRNLRHGIQKNHTDKVEIYLYRKTSLDGIHWTSRETLANIIETWGAELLSPSLIYEKGYKMWAVKYGGDPKQIVLIESDDAKNWKTPVTCVFTDVVPRPWHIDVQFIDDFYWLVDYELSNCINLYKSSDGINFSFVKTLIKLEKVYGAMDEYGLYRASLVKVSDSDYRLFYSTKSRFQTHIALLRGRTIEDMNPVNIAGGKYHSFLGFVGMSCKRVWVRLVFEVSKFLSKK